MKLFRWEKSFDAVSEFIDRFHILVPVFARFGGVSLGHFAQKSNILVGKAKSLTIEGEGCYAAPICRVQMTNSVDHYVLPSVPADISSPQSVAPTFSGQSRNGLRLFHVANIAQTRVAA